MNICIVNHNFKLGGVQRVAIELANSFQKENHHVTLIDFSGENKFYYDLAVGIKTPCVIRRRKMTRKILRKALYVKYKINRTPLHTVRLYKEQVEDIIKYLKKSNHEVLILCQGILTALIPVIKEQIPGIKIVTWQHNDYDVYTKQYYKEIINDYLKGIELADLVVCLTAADIDKFKKINFKSCNIYNPLTISKPRISELNQKNIVFVGRLSIEQKGLDYLIEIAKELEEEWTITVAGDGEDKEKFIQLIKKNKLENKIILKGPLKSAEMQELYYGGSILISTSRWEGFGLVITEAMACGLPIISFKNLGPTEILKNGDCGILIDQYDIESFVSKLKRLMENKRHRELLQKKSLERVKDFNINVISNKWISKLKAL
ncbi:glycosyltransferase [Niallia sp. 01092]|uniref:glycosyltransferase n=1 Tax=unclassified Niallia TaxID=2837522 RepID=UPI003FD22620